VNHLAALLLPLAAAVFVGCADGHRAPVSDTTHARAAAASQWRVEPSFKYEALCLVGILNGDPYYREYYAAWCDRLEPTLTPEVRAALAEIKRLIKDEAGGIVSASLCLYFSAVPAQTLDQLIAAIDDPETVLGAVRRTPYWDADAAGVWRAVCPPLRTVLSWMRDAHLERLWREDVLPEMQPQIDAIRAQLQRYAVIPLVDEYLGRRTADRTITVYVLNFNAPHGIKLVGNTYITHHSWPIETTVRTAAHEMMHPPYDRATDAELRAALDTLRQDPLLMNRVTNHNPSFGYNDFEGFVEEDCVQALDQRIAEKLGVADDPRQRWRASDDGMHVLAMALYQLFREQAFPTGGETFRDFLLRAVRTGELAPGRIAELQMRLLASGAP
jgi:hypothetical protein